MIAELHAGTVMEFRTFVPRFICCAMGAHPATNAGVTIRRMLARAAEEADGFAQGMLQSQAVSAFMGTLAKPRIAQKWIRFLEMANQSRVTSPAMLSLVDFPTKRPPRTRVGEGGLIDVNRCV
jgi:hypothetical protein